MVLASWKRIRRWLKGRWAEAPWLLVLLHLGDRLSPCDTVWNQFSTTWSTQVSSLGPCVQHMLSLKMYFSPFKLSSCAMLIAYFLPSFVCQSSDPRAPCQKVEKNASARGEGTHLPRLARQLWGRAEGIKLVRHYGQLCWCVTVESISTDQPPPPSGPSHAR